VLEEVLEVLARVLVLMLREALKAAVAQEVMQMAERLCRLDKMRLQIPAVAEVAVVALEMVLTELVVRVRVDQDLLLLNGHKGLIWKPKFIVCME
jgi:hypothetical protein